MGGVAPTNPISPASPAQASSGSTAANVTPVGASISNAPDKIQLLTHQIQITGTLAGAPNAGQITVNTAMGALTVTLPQVAQDQQQNIEQQLLAMFQTQKPLTIVVQPGNPPTDAFVLLPQPTSSASTGTAATPPLQDLLGGGQALPNAPPAPLVAGALLPAVVLQPIDNTLGASLSTMTSSMINGGLAADINAAALNAEAGEDGGLTGAESLSGNASSTVALSVSAPATASLAVQAASNVSAGASPLESAISTPVVAPANPSTLSVGVPSANGLAPGTQLSVTVDQIISPSGQIPVPTQPNQMVATVIGAGPGGQLLIQAGENTLYVQQPTSVPVGSNLLITLAPSADTLVVLRKPDMGDFGALQPALAALASADPALAHQMLENLLPQPNAALAGNLFLLFAAFGQGDASAWLGLSASDLLNKLGKAELIARISQALQEGGQVVSDPIVGSWHSYLIPLFNNAQMQIMNFYVHGDHRSRGRGSQEEQTRGSAKTVRFLIDVRMSKLGALQLDGFLKPKLLDMIIRSESALPPGLDRELRASYTNVLSAIGYAGTMAFQNGKQNWLLIRNPIGAGSVVT